jgi:protein TonB
MRLWSRTTLYALSVGAHAVLGVALGTIPPPRRHEVVAISFTETKKPKPPAPAQLPPEPEPPPAPTIAPVRAKVAPPATAKAEPPSSSPARASSGLDALPDFGLALGGGGPGGLAIPAGGGGGPVAAPAPAQAKTLARAAAPKIDECLDPPAKPKVLTRTTPAYTAEARAAGVGGKVRVEIVVDDRGRVVTARIIEGLGHGLDEAALAAARAMTFDAAVRCGKAVSATFKIGFTFSPSAP